MDGGWLPLPTRPQQYCDPVSLVGTSGSLSMYGVTIDEEEQKQISSMTNSRMLLLKTLISPCSWKVCRVVTKLVGRGTSQFP